jgi:hypothetical protein
MARKTLGRTMGWPEGTLQAFASQIANWVLFMDANRDLAKFPAPQLLHSLSGKRAHKLISSLSRHQSARWISRNCLNVRCILGCPGWTSGRACPQLTVLESSYDR